MFLGQFDHAVDPKGRVAVPASFRPGLAPGAVVTIGLEGRLVIWPTSAFEDHLRTHPITAGTPAEQRLYQRAVYAGTHPVELDAQGRLLLHPSHREFAEIRDRATFIGMGDYIELCAVERWSSDREQLTADTFTELSDRINPAGLARTPLPS